VTDTPTFLAAKVKKGFISLKPVDNVTKYFSLSSFFRPIRVQYLYLMGTLLALLETHFSEESVTKEKKLYVIETTS
jgi:hypothetical protein